MPLARVRVAVATLWAGSLWTVGYLVAPVLFATLADRALAGTIAGSMFRAGALLSAAFALLMLALLAWSGADLEPKRRRLLFALVLAMLGCVLLNYLGIQPLIAGIREAAGPGGLDASPQRKLFGVLHGASMLVYMVQSALAGVLIWKQR
ncbi:hypothetical protein ACFDR9_002434 [Janthinobacterium sp. CG_23.3]|uniref:DUF4149 domain-containing protein n=1 Tax=unclassified Janthinobacterium TaxID=2610881 RepID=UPI00034BF18C|nr:MULTISPECIES: DUF4149 domain-containing protein [unclassified Janthinobacterium]MEC5163221.1 hypothetical protein [Janthinobacterium sp. CG_S6]